MPDRHRKCFIGVASRDHVGAGLAGGFCQLGHGKRTPLLKLAAGDLIAYYSPRQEMQGGDAVQAFTAIGEIEPGDVTLARMGPGREAYRRAVAWWPAREAPIKPLLASLSFITDRTRWGYAFRRGSFAVPENDFRAIATAMGVGGRMDAARIGSGA